jgi:hypothetical protein
VVQAIEAADAALGKLISGLKERDMFDAIDIILVYAPIFSCCHSVMIVYCLLHGTHHNVPRTTRSDHGMTALSPERVIRLQDYINPATVRVINDGPVLMIIPNSTSSAQ